MNENEKMLIFERGVKMGIQMMMNKIESNCEKGKQCLAMVICIG